MGINTDIAVVGAGLTGMVTALALAQKGIAVVLIERRPIIAPKGLDGRALALNDASVQWLKAQGFWDEMAFRPCPIQQVHVSEQGQRGRLVLDANEHRLDALGEVVHIEALIATLLAKLKSSDVDVFAPYEFEFCADGPDGVQMRIQAGDSHETIHARYLLVADGARSNVREQLGISAQTRDYQAEAIVSQVHLSRDHGGIAYERFTGDGAIAFLPMQGPLATAVWTANKARIKALMGLSDEAYRAELAEHFGYRLGRLKRVGERFTYPLYRVVSDIQYRQHCVLLGNTAHQLQPLAAQGFNLSLANVAALVAELAQTHGTDAWGSVEPVSNYVAERKSAQQQIIGFTDALVSVFTTNSALLKRLRPLGLRGLQRLQKTKQRVSRVMLGG